MSNRTKRYIDLYINGQQVENDIRSVNVAMRKLKNEQARMTIGSKEYVAKTKQIRQLKGVLDEHRMSINKTQKSWLGLGGSMRGISSQFLAMTGGIYAVFGALRNAAQRVVQFDKSMQNMAGIIGQPRQELADLEKVIKDVAGSSIKTSNQVADLATTLLTLGKTKEEVKLMLKPVNDLSIALNAGSADTAEFLGQTLNAFGEGADQADYYADIIANMRMSTALDFEKLKDSMGYVAPTAHALGLTIGETGAIIGTLNDNGIKAARAGRLMNTTFSRLIDKGISLDEALRQINNRTDKVATASNLFGGESFSLGLILADNIDKVRDLGEEFDNLSGGSLKTLTDEQLQSLDAKLKILDSTWEQFILNIENGQGFLGKVFKNAIEGITDFVKIMDKASQGQWDDIWFFRENHYWKEAEEEKTQATKEEVEKRISELNNERAAYEDNLNQIKTSYEEFYKKDLENWDEVLASKDGAQVKHWMHQISEIDKQLKKEEKVLEGFTKKVEGAGNATDDNTDSVEGLSAEQKKLLDIMHQQYLEAVAMGEEYENMQDFWDQNLLNGLQNKIDELEKIQQSVEDAMNVRFDNEEETIIEPEIDQATTEFLEQSYDTRREILQTFFDNGVISYQEFRDRMREIDEEENANLGAGIINAMQKVAEFAQYAASAYNAFAQLKQAQDDAELARFEEEDARKRELLEERLQNGELSRKQYNNSIATLDKELEAKQRKMEYEAAKRQKTQALFGAIISAAQAVINGLNAKPFLPVGIAMGALAGILGAVQVAAISKQPLPAYYYGGYTNGDKIYRAGEGGTEYIAPNWQVNDPVYGPIIDELNNARQGKRNDLFSAMTSTGVPSTRAIDVAGGVGGSTNYNSTTTTTNINNTTPNEDLKVMTASILRLEKYMSDPKNRQAFISNDLRNEYESEMNALDSVSRME